MSKKEGGDPAAAALAQKRWDNTPKKDRTAHGTKMANARWEGHEAKRPASARKKQPKKKKT
jgi:hypothetical protein